MRVLITGAAGNLGSLLARHLLRSPYDLHLLEHRTPVLEDLRRSPNVEVFRADLGDEASLLAPCIAVDCVIHFAGLLFAPEPEKFLPTTNIAFVANLARVAAETGVQKFILVSFPQVEDETTPEHRATDHLDRESPVIHFRTRLAAERTLFHIAETSKLTPVIFRSGLVYGPGVKLVEAARKLLRVHLLAVWRRPTWVHPIALPDFLSAMEAAIRMPEARGIYNIVDDQPVLLQDFLDMLADALERPRPWRLPEFCFRAAAAMVETVASWFGSAAPLTRDIIRAGMTSCAADNSRMKQELLPVLRYPTAEQGMEILRDQRKTADV